MEMGASEARRLEAERATGSGSRVGAICAAVWVVSGSVPGVSLGFRCPEGHENLGQDLFTGRVGMDRVAVEVMGMEAGAVDVFGPR